MKQKVDRPIVVGMVGTGYGCELHGGGYENMVEILKSLGAKVWKITE